MTILPVNKFRLDFESKDGTTATKYSYNELRGMLLNGQRPYYCIVTSLSEAPLTYLSMDDKQLLFSEVPSILHPSRASLRTLFKPPWLNELVYK